MSDAKRGAGTLERMNDWATHQVDRPWFRRFERVTQFMFLHVEMVGRGLRATTWPRAIGWFVAALAWAIGLILVLALPAVLL